MTETLHHFPTSSYTLKQTCSDFLVNEIGLDGQVVKEVDKVIDMEENGDEDKEARDPGCEYRAWKATDRSKCC